jgi:hypothetical protein
MKDTFLIPQQEKFQYGRRPPGIVDLLFPGTSEAVDESSPIFAVLEKINGFMFNGGTTLREVSSGERWYVARCIPYRTAQDQIAGVILTFLDITE